MDGLRGLGEGPHPQLVGVRVEQAHERPICPGLEHLPGTEVELPSVDAGDREAASADVQPMDLSVVDAGVGDEQAQEHCSVSIVSEHKWRLVGRLVEAGVGVEHELAAEEAAGVALTGCGDRQRSKVDLV